MSAARATYRHLAAADPGVPLSLNGLVVEDGAIVLAPLAGTAVAVDAAESAPPLAGPAGAASDAVGAVYISDPDGDRILVLAPCDAEPAPLPCVRGGSGPLRVRAPGGLAVDARRVLYIADRGNHRVQAIDPRSGVLLAVIGQADPYDAPAPGNPPAGLREPADVALDASGRLYVADRGNGRVARFALPGGEPDAAFTAALVQDPTHIAVAVFAGAERLVVLDATAGPLVHDLDGAVDAELTGTLAQAVQASLAESRGGAEGLAVAGDRILVGDPTGRRVLAFDGGGRLVGAVPGFRGRATALAFDRRGRLVVGTGGGGAVRLDARGRAQGGSFVLGPIRGDAAATWHRVRAIAGEAPAGTRLQLSVWTADDETAPPPVAAWQAGPPGQADLRVLAGEGCFLWIAGTLAGPGDATPAVRALRVTWNHEGWARWLPAVYAREAERDALDGLLALLESGLDEQEEAIAGLPACFDPGTAPDAEAAGRWLDWLAAWQALELDARWSEADRRRAVRRAFAAHGRRGTARGLRDAIRDSLGVRARIDEPAAGAELWRLGDEEGALGGDTMLAAAEADGAVLGRTATLGRSHLIEAGDEGAPLFADIAHRFCVTVSASELATEGAREALVALVDRERPAHAAWTLRVVGAHARVGLQARLGVDAVVGRPADPLVAGGALGDAALAGAHEPVRVGVDATAS